MFAIGRESINVVGWDQRAFASAGPPFSWVDDRGPALRWFYPAKNHNLEAKKDRANGRRSTRRADALPLADGQTG